MADIEILSPVEKHMLCYVLEMHRNQARRRCDAIALFIHSRLLAFGASPCDLDGNVGENSLLPEDWAGSDLIRLNYKVKYHQVDLSKPQEHLVFFTTVENGNSISMNMTDSVSEAFGHADLTGPEFVRLDYLHEAGDVNRIFVNIERLNGMIRRDLFDHVLPKPPPQATTSQSPRPPPSLIPVVGGPPPQQRYPFQPAYGAPDLDPLAGVGGPGSGMLIDPNQVLRGPFGGGLAGTGGSSGNPFGGMVPPGARFDPIGPPMMPLPGRGGPRGGRFSNPDPDSALPPGWDDMYM